MQNALMLSRSRRPVAPLRSPNQLLSRHRHNAFCWQKRLDGDAGSHLAQSHAK
jgi:hypothetical protein